MDDDNRTLTEVAQELGVHYMTAYRYVRLGLLPATKVGTRWQVRRDDIAELDRPARSRRPAATGGASRSPSGETAEGGYGRAPWAERYHARAVASDQAGAWAVLEAAQVAGASVESLYTAVIEPAMRTVGERWAAGELDVADEHRASAVTGRLLARLSPRLVRPGPSRPSVVLGGAPGDHHWLPVTMTADLVISGGWDVIDLGADVPARSFVHAARSAARLGAVGISLSVSPLEQTVAELVTYLHAELPGVPVALGGSSVKSEAHARALGADLWAPNGLELVEALEGAVTPAG